MSREAEVSQENLTFIVEIFPNPFVTFEAGAFVKFLGFVVPIVFRDELHLAGFVFLASLGGREDREEFPIGVVNGILQIAVEMLVPFVGVGGFDQVVDEPEEKGAVSGAHELFGSRRFCFAQVVGLTAIGVDLFAFAGAE
jgi:hypothetical protein